MNRLTGRSVVLGVTGGIAAYKSADLASRLKKEGAEVRVIMTEHATRFIAPLTFESITGNQVHVSLFDFEWEIGHISLAKGAELLLIAPCTANVIGKLTNGLADDLLTTTAMATTAPILLAPAMNNNMWASAANQDNIKTLRARGVHLIGPGVGWLACGDEDIGRMVEPPEIVEAAVAILSPNRDLEGRRILVTAGPTREPIDPVRYLSNRSSGKMGYAIASAARARGAEVTLVSGPVNLSAPEGVEVVDVVTTADLYAVMTRRAPDFDAVIQAGAPSDFRPAAVEHQKIKRTGADLTLALVPNPDVAQQLGQDKRPGQVLVAFAAETEDLIENARLKLQKKRADIVIANDVSRADAGFDVDTNVISIVTPDGVEALDPMTKRRAADAILDAVCEAFLKKGAHD